MKKEFIEYHSENNRAPIKGSTLCNCLTQYVRNYIKENRNEIINIDKNVRDAVLVDSINYLGAQGGFSYALYTKDLYTGFDEETVDPQILLTIMQNHYAIYIFEYGIVDSVLRNKHMNNCMANFNDDDGAKILVDFINYIAQVNDYDRKFTINDLHKKFLIQKHCRDMYLLKEFLEKVSNYSEKLSNGESINNIFNNIAEENNLKYIAEDGTYYYNDAFSELSGQSTMSNWRKEIVEDEIYAMAYAYSKLSDIVKEKSQIEEINKKVLEMKKR